MLSVKGIKGNGYTFRGGNCVKIVLPSTEKGPALKEKNLLQEGAISFLFD